MSSHPCDPLNLLNQLQGDLNKVFESRLGHLGGSNESAVATSDWIPAVDIREEPQSYVILADIPGVDPAQIEITMENGVLSIRGERRLEGAAERASYRRVERVRGSFYRRFSMPDNAAAEQIQARGRNGVLEITVPKQERAQRRTIKVDVQ